MIFIGNIVPFHGFVRVDGIVFLGHLAEDMNKKGRVYLSILLYGLLCVLFVYTFLVIRFADIP